MPQRTAMSNALVSWMTAAKADPIHMLPSSTQALLGSTVWIQGAVYTNCTTLYHGHPHRPMHPGQIAAGVAKSFQGDYFEYLCDTLVLQSALRFRGICMPSKFSIGSHCFAQSNAGSRQILILGPAGIRQMHANGSQPRPRRCVYIPAEQF